MGWGGGGAALGKPGQVYIKTRAENRGSGSLDLLSKYNGAHLLGTAHLFGIIQYINKYIYIQGSH